MSPKDWSDVKPGDVLGGHEFQSGSASPSSERPAEPTRDMGKEAQRAVLYEAVGYNLDHLSLYELLALVGLLSGKLSPPSPGGSGGVSAPSSGGPDGEGAKSLASWCRQLAGVCRLK